jgi:hypothetical protein
MKPARTETFEHTISGLLTKRADLFNEAERIRDRLAEIKNDIGAIDRTLTVLGYSGDLDAAMPRQKRDVIFGKGELTRAIYDELRVAETPMTSRDIARGVIALQGVSPSALKTRAIVRSVRLRVTSLNNWLTYASDTLRRRASSARDTPFCSSRL